ncbi:MAG: VOC family protein [Myxococcaceae bacterium]|nr:VOC family protein [Myxococcaceae bacterium]
MQLTIHHLGLTTRDVARSADFYVRLFDATVEPAPKTGHSFVCFGGLRLALVPWREGDPQHHAWGDHLAVTCPAHERDVLLNRLAKLGARTQEVHGRIYAHDPDGYTLEFTFQDS